MTDYQSKYEKEMNNLCEIVTRNIGDALDHLSEARKNAQIFRLAHSLRRLGLCTEEDIINVSYDTNRIVYNRLYKSSRYLKIVAENVKGEYDDITAKKERLASIDKEIARLNRERENILKVLEGK